MDDEDEHLKRQHGDHTRSFASRCGPLPPHSLHCCFCHPVRADGTATTVSALALLPPVRADAAAASVCALEFCLPCSHSLASGRSRRWWKACRASEPRNLHACRPDPRGVSGRRPQSEEQLRKHAGIPLRTKKSGNGNGRNQSQCLFGRTAQRPRVSARSRRHGRLIRTLPDADSHTVVAVRAVPGAWSRCACMLRHRWKFAIQRTNCGIEYIDH